MSRRLKPKPTHLEDTVTSEQVLVLPAGNDLDELVALLCLGWKRTTRPGEYPFKDPAGGGHLKVPSFSGPILGWHKSLWLCMELFEPFAMSLSKMGPNYYEAQAYSPEGDCSEVGAPTPQLAVCRAAVHLVVSTRERPKKETP